MELLLMNLIDKTKKDTSFVKMFAFITKIREQWRFQENGVRNLHFCKAIHGIRNKVIV